MISNCLSTHPHNQPQHMACWMAKTIIRAPSASSRVHLSGRLVAQQAAVSMHCNHHVTAWLQVLAFLFELGCIFHSVIIGITLGVNTESMAVVRHGAERVCMCGRLGVETLQTGVSDVRDCPSATIRQGSPQR